MPPPQSTPSLIMQSIGWSAIRKKKDCCNVYLTVISSITKTKIKTIIPNSLYPVSDCLVAPRDFNKYGSKTKKKLELSTGNYLSNGLILYNIVLSTPFKIDKKDNFIKAIFTSMGEEKLAK